MMRARLCGENRAPDAPGQIPMKIFSSRFVSSQLAPCGSSWTPAPALTVLPADHSLKTARALNELSELCRAQAIWKF
jgi:hypothetical protein